MPPDGCPKKYTLVEVKKDRIEIKQQVHFASGKWLVLPGSYALLNQVVAVLNRIDVPKSPVKAWPSQIAYCARICASWSCRRRSMAAASRRACLAHR